MRGRCRAATTGRWPGCVLLLAFSLLPGCVLDPRLELGELAGPTSVVRVPSLSYFPQTAHQCGPAALASVLRASGVDTTPEQLSEQVYLPGREGSLQAELLGATRRAGRIPYRLAQSPRSLVAELRAGRPVLVMQNLLTRTVPAWHYAVLAGYDSGANRLLLNSGARVGASKFLRTWDWAGRWAMVALQPGELPAEADKASWFEALAAFERVAGPESSARAWQSTADHWPDDPFPYLALGNLAYQNADLPGAIGFYRHGLTLDARDPVLSNNLATVLGEAGCARLGEQLLRAFANSQGDAAPWRSDMEATRAELAAHPGEDSAACAGYGHLRQDRQQRCSGATCGPL